MSTPQLRTALSGVLVTNRRIVFTESILLFLLVWEFSARIFGMTELIASPVLVGTALIQLLQDSGWIQDFIVSMRRVLYGFTAALIVGVFAGVLLGVSDFWKEALRYYVLVGMAVPGLFIVIFTAMAFGISDMTPMIATAVITAPFIADMIQSGVEDIDPDLLNMSSSFNVSQMRVYRRVLFPAILPEVFSAIRFTFSVAWKVTILAEVVISSVGIGFLVSDNMSRLSMTGVLKYITIFVFVMMVIEYGVFRQLEKYLFDWREDVKSAVGAGVR